MAVLRATEIFNDSIQRLIAIESVDYGHIRTGASYHLYGKIDAIAVIVCRSDGIVAFDMKAGPIELEQLRQDIPGLDDIIAPFNNA